MCLFRRDPVKADLRTSGYKIEGDGRVMASDGRETYCVGQLDSDGNYVSYTPPPGTRSRYEVAAIKSKVERAAGIVSRHKR